MSAAQNDPMPIDERELRSLTRELDDVHHETLPSMCESLAAWRAQNVGRAEFQTIPAILIAALCYWVLTIIFSLFQDRLERRLSRGER